jgi:hypothetical protein
MKTEDLMVGNWVSYGDGWFRVSKNDLTSQLYAEQLKPIPLTEETIKLLGFEKLKIDWYYKIITINGAYIQLPKHVHKLQQLIKALEE